MKIEKTNRGFARADFVDINGDKCSIQKSSLATDEAIWLGINDPRPMICVKGVGRQEVPLPEGAACLGRMHLSREHVAKLLPMLQHFVETGELPN